MTNEPMYPEVVVLLTGKNGNVFNLIGSVQHALQKAGKGSEAKAFTAKAFAAGSYDDVLQLCLATVTVE